MKTLKLIIIALLLGTTGLSKAFAFDFWAVCPSGDTLYYEITNLQEHEVAVVRPGSSWYGHTQPTGDIVLPDMVTNPNNGVSFFVTSIGDYAFGWCNGITSIAIPNSVSFIANNILQNCNDLVEIIVEAGNTMYDSRNGCNAIIETESNTLIVGCKNTSIPNTVTSIGDYAFYFCKGFTSINIPNSVTTIGKSAFSGSNLTSITIPNSVTSIGHSAFSSCSDLNSIDISNSLISIGDYAFSWCNGLKSIDIPNSVTTIGDCAFSWCNGLISISISSSVVSIGRSAFYHCSENLEEIVVDANNTMYDSREDCNAIIETVSNKLIIGCKNTKIPNTVESISDNAFYECRDIVSITIPNSVTEIDNFAFYKCSGLISLVIPESVVSIHTDAFGECSGLESIEVDSNNPIYDSRNNCNAIIKTSDNKLIQGCKNTIIPNTVTCIGIESFIGCSGLVSIDIPNSVTSIERYAFGYCSGLTSISIPNTVSSIEIGTFRNCDNLEYVFIPNSVNSIGTYAFSGCFNMKVIAMGALPPSLQNNVFSGFGFLIVPCGSKEAYMESDWNDYFVTIDEDCNLYNIDIMDADGGSISLSQSQARLGEEVMIIPNPNQDFVLLSVILCNADDETQLVPVWENKFTMPNFHVIVKPYFSHTSVNENGTIPVSIYPNPVKNKVTIETESIQRISISNTMGQLIYKGVTEGESFEYDFSSHEAGVYLIRIETSNGTVSKRIVVTK